MAESSELRLSNIGQIAINVKDVDRAEKFYRDTLGMKHLFRAGNLTFFDCDGVRLMLATPDKPEFDHPASILYFRVKDITRAAETLKSRGVKFEEEPRLIARMDKYDLWIGAFRDSENNLLALMSEKPTAEAQS